MGYIYIYIYIWLPTPHYRTFGQKKRFFAKKRDLGPAGVVSLDAQRNSVQVGGVNASKSCVRDPFDAKTIVFALWERSGRLLGSI